MSPSACCAAVLLTSSPSTDFVSPSDDLPSPPPSPVLGQPSVGEVFRPSLGDLSDSDSVLMPVSSITGYLDSALKVLGLHTEARTSFITYVFS